MNISKLKPTRFRNIGIFIVHYGSVIIYMYHNVILSQKARYLFSHSYKLHVFYNGFTSVKE